MQVNQAKVFFVSVMDRKQWHLILSIVQTCIDELASHS